MDCEGLLAGPDLTVCQAARAAADAAVAATKLAEGDSWSETVVAILGAIGALALPVMAIVVVVKVWPILREVFETRKFTLKIGGFELSAQEATDQIRKQIEELQSQVAQLKEAGRVSAIVREGANSDIETPEEIRSVAPVAQPGALLWVDDKPSNNAFLIADFQDQGIRIDQAVSTTDALQKLSAQSAAYQVIISDLGRIENERFVPDAGGQLAKEVRAMGLSTPLIIFSSARAVQDRERLIKAGATDVTNNSTRLRTSVLRHFKGRTG
jgi:CheY-like chemotaxis protein